MKDITSLARIEKLKKKLQAFCGDRYDREFDIIKAEIEYLEKVNECYQIKEQGDLHPHLKAKGL